MSTQPKAEQIEFTPSGGGLVATNLQAALSELDSEAARSGALAASSGSSLVGYDGGTVQDVLDGAKSLQDYAALRAYTGGAKRIYITGLMVTAKQAGIAGVFQYDQTDTTSSDNGGTIIVGADGRRFKRDYVGEVYVTWFNSVGNGIADDTAAVKSALAVGQTKFIPTETYRLTQTVDLIEPFDIDGCNANFKIDHSGIGFHVKASTYPKKNICSFKNFNFIAGAVPPDCYIKVGVASALEPTNIEINGVHFVGTNATTAHVINERGYGLKITNSAFSEVTGTCILFKSGIGADESTYSYNCYVNHVDITGADYGIIIEGGKVEIEDSIIESCRQRAVWSKGISFNPSVFMENVYFENNLVSLYFESQQSQGYTRNGEVKNCFFSTNATSCYFSSNNEILLVNNKGFNLNSVTGAGRLYLLGALFPVSYNANNCPDIFIGLQSPARFEYGNVAANTRIAVPYFNLKKRNLGRTNTAMKITIVRNVNNNVSYYQGILQASDPAGITYRTLQIAAQNMGGIEYIPTFEKNPADPNDMNLYFYFASSGTLLVTVEGEGGFG